MLNIRCKLVTTGLLTTGLCAGLVFTNIAWSYDGDIDYLAPYVTLDQASGKLVTVDPRKDAAAAAKLEQEHNASNPNATTSAAASANTTQSTPSASDTTSTIMSAPTSNDQNPTPSSTANAAVIAIGMLVVIGLIVAVSRRKSGAVTENKSQV
jgi:hypothetical protein